MPLYIYGPLSTIAPPISYPKAYLISSISVSSGTYPLTADPSGNGPDVFGTAVSINNGLTYKVYTFTRFDVTYTVNYTCNDASKPIYMLAVGGGGGGGSFGGGGGGAGGMIDQSFSLVAGTSSITVNIGKGGFGQFPNGYAGGQGGNTIVSFASINKQIIAGGGCGGSGHGAVSTPSPYSLFGSGGGGYTVSSGGSGISANTNETGGTYYSPLVVYAQPGGSGYGANPGAGGGGGGASASGTNATTSTTQGNGGDGKQTVCYGIKEFNPNGTPYGNYFWAGGGGGSSGTPSATAGNGGSGGGGGGISSVGTQGTGSTTGLNPGINGSTTAVSSNGGQNTGGGGGGDWNNNSTYGSGNGGSGIVIIAFPQ